MSPELVIRFLAGGILVSVFAVLGDLLRPKSFAGVFGAAPSVALASLALAFISHDGDYAAVEARSMLAGGPRTGELRLARQLATPEAARQDAPGCQRGAWRVGDRGVRPVGHAAAVSQMPVARRRPMIAAAMGVSASLARLRQTGRATSSCASSSAAWSPWPRV